MGRFQLIGPSYESQSLTADCQVTRNFYPEIIESQSGKSATALYPTPGTKTKYTLPGGGPIRAQLEINGRYFAISGTNFCECFANNTFNVIGQVTNDLLPASMVASPQQLLIAAGGNLYVYQLQTQANRAVGTGIAGTFNQIPNANFTLPGGAIGNPSMVEYIDGFFIVLLRNSQTIYISTPLDATSWPPLQIIVVTVFSDNVQSIVESQRRLAVLGRKRSTTYYDSGGPNIFDVDPSGTVENGSAAVFAFCRADNSIFWLDQDERGAGIVRRNSGYTPVRVSNHAVEFAMQGYATLSDCVMYSYQDQGHTFVCMIFPTASKFWVYDIATGMWHERAYWNIGTGMFSAHKSQNHAQAFGQHLVGDPGSGNIYQMAIPSQVGGVWSFVTDNNNPIRRVRRAPHISKENRYSYYSELIIDVETGLGPMPPLLDGAGNPRGPQIMLRWSRDYAHTWSNEYMLDCGQAGEYRKRARKSRLGRARDMVFELSVSDPIGWRLIEGYLEATDYAPQERLVKSYAKVA